MPPYFKRLLLKVSIGIIVMLVGVPELLRLSNDPTDSLNYPPLIITLIGNLYLMSLYYKHMPYITDILSEYVPKAICTTFIYILLLPFPAMQILLIAILLSKYFN